MAGDAEDDLPILPGFREMAVRRRALLDELVAHRRAAGLSQGEVAERMGTSQPAVARLEAGQVDARMSTMQRYAEAVGARLRLGVEPAAVPPGVQPAVPPVVPPAVPPAPHPDPRGR
jgi:DNA-binding XRE family transcriptional regulator